MIPPLDDIARRVGALKPGARYEVDFNQYRAPALASLFPAINAPPLWAPEDQVMSKIVGSAYEFRFWKNHERGTITFERLPAPLSNGLRTHVSPDIADQFERTPQGFYKRKG